MKKIFIRSTFMLFLLYSIICGYMYTMQESFIFHPRTLKKTIKIEMLEDSKERSVETKDGHILSGVLCKTQKSKKNGLVFFLHGNTGNLLDLAETAKFYTNLGFDFFSFDYRSFGKSSGKLENEAQFFNDVKLVYDELTKEYRENSIVVVGYSIGTASAAMLAAKKNPSKLILISPYYSLIDMTRRNYSFIPTFLLKYKFETNKYLAKIDQPVLLVHGKNDQVLPFEGSVKLSKLLNNKSIFLSLVNQGHNDFELNMKFQHSIKEFLRIK